jgi:translation elongation factor EF-4
LTLKVKLFIRLGSIAHLQLVITQSVQVDWDSESFFLTIDDTSGNIDYQKERDRSIKKAEGDLHLCNFHFTPF